MQFLRAAEVATALSKPLTATSKSAGSLMTAAILATGLLTAAALPAHAMEAPYEAAAPADGGPRALSPADRLSYTTAFDALRKGDLELARRSARQAQDHVLLGEVEFERLFHRDHVATYEELSAWLDDYADLPMARRVYDLALRRRPDGAPEPRRPSGVGGRNWNSVVAAGGGSAADDPMKAARIALNADDLQGAYAMGEQIGDWWTVGLAAWRMDRFSDAQTAFSRVAEDPTEDPWVRAGAAFWAARSAARSGQQAQVETYLRLAAHWPATFYGQIALHQLGETPTIENVGPRPYDAVVQRASHRPREPMTVDPADLNAFIQSDPEARRAVALFEVGRRDEAESALRNGLRGSVEDTGRRMWSALAGFFAPRRPNGADVTRIDALNYPMPVIEPEGGFTIERALVYAIARKETGFNPGARSPAGAYGLMQVMPTTAAEMTGDRSFASQPTKLLDPAVNARLGQQYINRMLQMTAFRGDLLRAVASYNAGPGPMLGAIRKLGPDADPLLLIETIDVPQARAYVEEVVAAYWIYQRMLGAPVNTLNAVASGAALVPVQLDYVAPAQTQAVAMAAVDPTAR